MYLTVEAYVRKFGQQEAVLLTNEARPQAGVAPTYDPVKIEEQLTDAADVVDSYVSKRYATPLQNVPTIVRGWVAALARHKLYVATGRANDAVRDEADRVYRQLEQLAKGTLDIPVAQGDVAPAPTSAGNAQSSGDRVPSLFSGGVLDSYTAPVLGGYPAACWKGGG